VCEIHLPSNLCYRNAIFIRPLVNVS